jgi:hypothetical protein
MVYSEQLNCPAGQVCELTDTLCSLVAFNADNLKLAEDVCLNALRQRVVAPKDPYYFNEYNTFGSQLLEVALNTTDPFEAEASFLEAEAAFSHVTTVAHPLNEEGLRAKRWLAFTPVFRMRREQAAPDSMAAAAYRALGTSTAPLLPALQEVPPQGKHIRRILGLMAENCVAGLIAKAGIAPFPSSGREGKGDRALNSDFRTIGTDGKLALEVKYKYEHEVPDRQNRDTSRVLVITYAEICRRLGEERFPAHNRPTINKIGKDIAQAMIVEANDGVMPGHSGGLLARGSELVVGIINDWRAG